MSAVQITGVGYQSLAMLSRYMAEFIGLPQALLLAEQLIDVSVEKLAANPLSCPLCYELESLGITDYKQLTIEGYKVLYRYDAVIDTVFLTAFMRHKQSAEKLLVDYVLLNN